MKTSMMILVVSLALISCQESIDIEKEEEAIKAVIESSGQAWLDRDFDAMEEIWLQNEMTSRIAAGDGGYGFIQGYDNQMARYEDLFGENPDASANKELFDNYRISVNAESAWALVDHSVVNPEGDTLNSGLFTYILEKQEGQWKLAALSTIGISSYENMQRNMAISEIYHRLNPDDIDDILTDDFIGRDEIGGTWTKAGHKNFWKTNKGTASDSIMYQSANGNIVTTRFNRKGKFNGENVEGEALQIKRFEDGKIAEIWEYGFGVFKQ